MQPELPLHFRPNIISAIRKEKKIKNKTQGLAGTRDLILGKF